MRVPTLKYTQLRARADATSRRRRCARALCPVPSPPPPPYNTAVIDFRRRDCKSLHTTAHGSHTVRGVHRVNMSTTCTADNDDVNLTVRRHRSLGLIGCALVASEAAANIVRQCRANSRLLSMLVEEKCDESANRSRFARDFKTLADVLVQHVVVERLGRQVRGRSSHEIKKRFCNILH